MNIMLTLMLAVPLWAQVPPDRPEAPAEVNKESASAVKDRPAPVAATEAPEESRPAVKVEPQEAPEQKTPAKAAEKSAENTIDKAAEKPAEKPVEKAVHKAAEKPEDASDAGQERTAAKPSSKGKFDRNAAELGFLKSVLEDKDARALETAAADAAALAERAAEGPAGPDARLLAAQLLVKSEEWKAAAVAYLSFLYEYPDADAALKTKREYVDLVEKRMPRKLRSAMAELARVPDKPSKAERLAAMLKSLVDAAGDEVYEPLAAEFARFERRFPAYGESDRIQLSLADLHAKASKYDEALHALRRLIALHPESGLTAQAQWNIAALYADSMKKYDLAVESFQELVKRYPKTPMVLPSLQRTAALLEERMKDYPSAVDVCEKIVKLYPRTEGALKALQSEARIQRDRLKAYGEAVAAFKRVAEEFGAPAAVEALKDAASVARKNLKDYAQELELKKALSTRFPDADDAPDALYSVGEIYEDDLKDDAKAKESFEAVASKYPTHKLAKKAQDRLARIAKRSGQ